MSRRWADLVVVMWLGTIGLAGVIGLSVATVSGGACPPGLLAIVSGAVGALAGLAHAAHREGWREKEYERDQRFFDQHPEGGPR